jgi:hypothetical protein
MKNQGIHDLLAELNRQADVMADAFSATVRPAEDKGEFTRFFEARDRHQGILVEVLRASESAELALQSIARMQVLDTTDTGQSLAMCMAVARIELGKKGGGA